MLNPFISSQTYLGAAGIVISLIFLAVRWSGLPAETGIHFAGNGEFDIIADRRYICYPYIMLLLTYIFTELFCFLCSKVKIRKNLTEKGEEKMRAAVCVYLDICKVGFCIYFIYWAFLVMYQRPMNPLIPQAISLAIFLLFIALVAAMTVISSRNRDTI